MKVIFVNVLQNPENVIVYRVVIDPDAANWRISAVYMTFDPDFFSVFCATPNILLFNKLPT
jgi:hypothetical protein